MYAIWCRVSGGFTGTREAWLKGKDGKIKRFKTLAAAKREANKWNKQFNGNPYRTASFRYTAEEYR